jgi:hypothetical protein
MTFPLEATNWCDEVGQKTTIRYKELGKQTHKYAEVVGEKCQVRFEVTEGK